MTYIPNCREDEDYNEKYLNAMDKEFVRGFDYCLEMAVCNFFDNNFDGCDTSYIGTILQQNLPEHMRDRYEIEHKFGVTDEYKRIEVVETKTYADWLKSEIIQWVEAHRNDLIVSMLEDMDDDEYDQIKEQIDGQSEKEDR